LSTVVPSIAGPKRPQDRIELTSAKKAFGHSILDYARHEEQETNGLDESIEETFPASDPIAAQSHADDDPEPAGPAWSAPRPRPRKRVPVTLADGTETELDHGSVVIASIT